ncbi:MAG: zinc-binding dehydrogenase, partial [Anaerolineales bacterium]|nr:zinc-binding dehydrogenase [Anaerolineales bacterium]
VNSRLELAKKLGAEDTLNVKCEKIDKFKDSDVVIVSAGNKEAIQEALDIVRVGGKISIFAQTSDKTRVQLDPNLIYHETLILGTYSSTPIEQKEIFDMLVNGKLKDATSIISHRFPLKEFLVNEQQDSSPPLCLGQE